MSLPSLPSLSTDVSRRHFLQSVGVGAAALGLSQLARGQQPTPPIPGLANDYESPEAYVGWSPISDRKIRVGLVGYGVSHFGAAFGFQNHPNVEVVAVSDLFPDRCAALAKATGCAKTYPSLEELVKDDRIEAVFLATDAASHARHAMEVLKHDKHVASCVPAVFGSLEDADKLLAAVKSSGRTYMMYETSCFHPEVHAMRQIYNAGGFGKMVYTEGEYFHYMPKPLDSYKGWRIGMPPQWYCTHSNAYYVCVTGGTFTEVSCMGMKSDIINFRPENNAYKNPFATEVALFRTSEGGMARMTVSKDTPGGAEVEGRVRGQRGAYYAQYEGQEKNLPNLKRPPLPPGVPRGGHKGSHGYLTNEFVTALIQNRRPIVDVATALNITAAGIVAHESALRGGEVMKIPQYKL